MHYNEETELYDSFYIFSNYNLIIIHVFFFLVLIVYFFVNNQYLKIISGIFSFLLSILYFTFSIFHQNSLSWSVVGSPFLSLFLILLLVLFLIEYKLKKKCVVVSK